MHLLIEIFAKSLSMSFFIFSAKRFIVLLFTFRFTINLKLIFVSGQVQVKIYFYPTNRREKMEEKIRAKREKELEPEAYGPYPPFCAAVRVHWFGCLHVPALQAANSVRT